MADQISKNVQKAIKTLPKQESELSPEQFEQMLQENLQKAGLYAAENGAESDSEMTSEENDLVVQNSKMTSIKDSPIKKSEDEDQKSVVSKTQFNSKPDIEEQEKIQEFSQQEHQKQLELERSRLDNLTLYSPENLDFETLPYSQRRPGDHLKTALNLKQRAADYLVKTKNLSKAAATYETAIKQLIVALHDDIFIWKIREGLKEEKISAETNLKEEEKDLWYQLLETKAILHNNLALCYFKKLNNEKIFQKNSQERKDLELTSLEEVKKLEKQLRNLVIKNCSACIEILKKIRDDEIYLVDLSEGENMLISGDKMMTKNSNSQRTGTKKSNLTINLTNYYQKNSEKLSKFNEKAVFRQAKTLFDSGNFNEAAKNIEILKSSSDKQLINLAKMIHLEIKKQDQRLGNNLRKMF